MNVEVCLRRNRNKKKIPKTNKVHFHAANEPLAGGSQSVRVFGHKEPQVMFSSVRKTRKIIRATTRTAYK